MVGEQQGPKQWDFVRDVGVLGGHGGSDARGEQQEGGAWRVESEEGRLGMDMDDG